MNVPIGISEILVISLLLFGFITSLLGLYVCVLNLVF